MRILFYFPLLLVVFSSLLLGSKPLFWRSSTQKDFLKGTFRSVGLTSDGRLVQAPEIKLIFDTGQAFIYSLTVNNDGNVLVGTGTEGKLFRVVVGGKGVEIADFEEPGVHGLVVRPNGEILAATGPNGKVYRIGESGELKTFFDPKEKYIWDLTLDVKGNLFVATGPKGRIYRVGMEGRHTLVYDSSEQHIVDLSWDAEGNLLAGSSPGGLLMRIDLSGKPFVLLDSKLEEIRAINIDRYGNIYALGISNSSLVPRKVVETKSKASDPVMTTKTIEETVRIEGTKKGSQLELYRVARDGLIELLYSQDDQMALDLLVRQNGEVLMGTGRQGQLLSLTPARLKKILGGTSDEQITQMITTQNKIILATSNLGKLYRLDRGPGSSGTFESEPLDAVVTSRWGKIRWQVTNPSGEGILFSTRSGNTEKPDETWSKWSRVEGDTMGSSVESPSARYLQWKIDFSSSSDSTTLLSNRNGVDVVEVSYLQRNVAPQITEVSIHVPGSAFLSLPPSNPLNPGLGGPNHSHLNSLPPRIRRLNEGSVVSPRRIYTPSSQSVSWKAADLNGDDLVYDIYLQTKGELAWKELETNRKESYYTLDGASLPDGFYRFKIVVSDRISNPLDQSRQSSMISKLFTVANHLPALKIGKPQVLGNFVSINIEVRTQSSDVYQLEYSVDGIVWSIIHPIDGLADSKNETYELKLEGLSQARNSLLVRVVDSVGNLTTSRAEIKLP